MPKTITVKIELAETSQPIIRQALNTYTKGPFYVVYLPNESVEKYPLAKIWRVSEDYA